MIVTLYRGAKTSDYPILVERLEWSAFVASVTEALADEAPKLSMLAFAPHELAPSCACAKCAAAEWTGPHRLLTNVRAVTALAIDVDAGDPDAVREALEHMKWPALIYESSSSTDDAPRFRVVAPVSRPLTVAETKRARLAFAEALGLTPGCGVEGALDASRVFFVGRIPGTRARKYWEVK